MRLALALLLLAAPAAAERSFDEFSVDYALASRGEPLRSDDHMFEPLYGRGVRVTSLAHDTNGLEARFADRGRAPLLLGEVKARLAAASLGTLDVEVDPHGTARIHGPVAHASDGARAAWEALQAPGVIAVEVDVY